MAVMMLRSTLVLATCGAALAFMAPVHTGVSLRAAARSPALSVRMQAQESHLSRRDLPSLLAKSLLAGAVAPSLLTAFPAPSAAAAGALGSPESPIVVIGSAGKTGKECVKRLAAAGYTVRATTRGESSLEKLGVSGGNVQLMAGIDVTKPETLEAALAGAGAVIFTSSASSKGGNALAVDCLGVENIARAAIAAKVPRLAVVSSVGVTRADSLAFKFTNIFGNVMDYKEQGEERLRAIYAGQDGLSYTVVRPGGLSNGKGVGITNLQISQGDTSYTEVDRVDVAEVTVASLFFSAAAGTTFEVYQRSGVKPIQDDLKKTMYAVSGAHTTDAPAKASDAVLSEASLPAYSAFFAGLKKDSDFAVTNGYKAQKPVA
ncbi:hypothetical protein T484DRAFT_1930840 [Baffinella frigidus]|nr:hypothetical protein T484DRAFT_1930840 [Cryptophyta sp. CCMP2293]